MAWSTQENSAWILKEMSYQQTQSNLRSSSANHICITYTISLCAPDMMPVLHLGIILADLEGEGYPTTFEFHINNNILV